MIMDDNTRILPAKETCQDGRFWDWLSLIICGLVFIIGVYKNLPTFDMFMTSVSPAVAEISEGLPAIVTISFH